MKFRLNKLMTGVLAVFAMMIFMGVQAKADSSNISVASASGNVGDIVSVDVTVSSDVNFGAQIYVKYDTNTLEFVESNSGFKGTAGIDQAVFEEGAPDKPQVLTIKFKLKAPGTAAVTVDDSSKVYKLETLEELSIAKSNGTVNISPAPNTTVSNDSHLSGLSVQAISSNGDSTAVLFTPSFSSEITEYKADLPSSTKKLVIATTLSNAKATTSISGTRIDPGANKTTITVTAEDGSKTVYTLYTNCLKETESTTQETPSQSEETTEFDRAPKHIPEINKYLMQDFSLVTIPEGFEESVAMFREQKIAVLKGIAKDLMLVCLADDVQGINAKLYLFTEASGTITDYVNITSTQKIYTIIPAPDDYQGPEGYVPTTLDINGSGVRAWVKGEGTDFYVVFAMNWDGETALYVYDAKEQTMQRFIEGNKSENVSDEPETENPKYLSMKYKYDTMYDEYVKDHNKKNKIIIALLVVMLIAAGGAAVLFVMQRKNAQYDNSDDDDDNDNDNDDESADSAITFEEQPQKELQLDMVAQVNEMKAEKLAVEVNELIKNELEDEENEIAENSQSTVQESEKTPDKNKDDEKNNEVVVEFSDENDAKNDEETVMINVEEDEPFEIEFIDLNDK